MRYSIVLAAIAVFGVDAQKCEKTSEVKPLANPLMQIAPGKAVFPCDFGASVPLGKVPKGCAQFEIIAARGTSEPGEFGIIVGDPLVARVKRDMPGVTVRGYPVQYPAGMSGSSTGVADVSKRIERMLKECPETKFALSGYSQGGMVVTSAASKMSAQLAEKVLAMVIYGAGEASSVKGPLKDRTLANCAPGDFACPKTGSGPGHTSYNNEGTVWHDRAAQYIVAAFSGKKVSSKTMKVPTGALQIL